MIETREATKIPIIDDMDKRPKCHYPDPNHWTMEQDMMYPELGRPKWAICGARMDGERPPDGHGSHCRICVACEELSGVKHPR